MESEAHQARTRADLLMLISLDLAILVELTKNERDLDLRQVQEVLCDVDAELVQEGWRNVVAVLNVVQVLCRVAQVFRAAEHCVVGAASALLALVE